MRHSARQLALGALQTARGDLHGKDALSFVQNSLANYIAQDIVNNYIPTVAVVEAYVYIVERTRRASRIRVSK